MTSDGRARVGIGFAEAARGLLVHRVSMLDGRVRRYQILAPTEWNFHPQGVVAEGLKAIARAGVTGAELERLARLYITAVDPCVDYQLSVS
jgi:coenzyme F420-reducing hydrogenase alpha subunit